MKIPCYLCLRILGEAKDEITALDAIPYAMGLLTGHFAQGCPVIGKLTKAVQNLRDRRRGECDES